MKVICAGAPKTGTKSMAAALRILGYGPVYDIEEAIEFAFSEWEDIFEGRVTNFTNVIQNVYANEIDAVVDFPHSCFFDQYLEKWPKAKVVLMVRDIEEWYESYKTMVEKAIGKYYLLNVIYYLSPSARRLLNWCWNMAKTTIGTVEPREVLWKSWYKRHNSYVRSIVPASQLLEFNVQEGWGPLCEFLDKDIPNVPFPYENQAGSQHNITDKMLQDTWIAKKMAQEIKLIFTVACILLVSACAFLYSKFV